MTKKAVCECFWGLGDAATDTASGEPLLRQKVAALGVETPPIWNHFDQTSASRAIHALPADTLVFAIAISCGANALSTLIRLVSPRKLAGVFAIAPSVWCVQSQPTIGDNAPNFWVFNGPYWSLPFPGLSAYQPQRNPGSYAPAIIRRTSPMSHPCDFDVVNVQNPIIAEIKRLVA